MSQAFVISKLHEQVQFWGIAVFFKIPRIPLRHLCSFLTKEETLNFSMLSVAHRHRLQGVLNWKVSLPASITTPAGEPALQLTARANSGTPSSSAPPLPRLAVYKAAPPKLQAAMDAVAATASAPQSLSPGSKPRRPSYVSYADSFSDGESRRGSTADSILGSTGDASQPHTSAGTPPRKNSQGEPESASRRFSFFRRQMISPGSGQARGGGTTRGPPLTPEQAGMVLAYTRQLDERLHSMKNRTSDLEASVATAETVKEFLAKKVTQLEQACAELNAKADSAAHKNVADQQVISFLDERTRELERERDAARKEVEDMKASLGRPGGKLREQVLATSMAAADAGEQPTAEAAAQWAKERKLLVAEVRRLRMLVTTRG